MKRMDDHRRKHLAVHASSLTNDWMHLSKRFLPRPFLFAISLMENPSLIDVLEKIWWLADTLVYDGANMIKNIDRTRENYWPLHEDGIQVDLKKSEAEDPEIVAALF